MEITVDDVISAILADHKGSSRAALVKFFESKSKADSSDGDLISLPLKKAIDAGVKSGELIAVTKQSFKVAC